MNIFNSESRFLNGALNTNTSMFVNPNDKQYASKTYANIIESQYADYMERFKPYEARMLDLAQSRELLDDQLSRITGSVNASFNNPQMSAGSLQMQRYGVQQGAQQQAKINRQNETQRALAIADAKNNTRVANQDQKMALITGASATRTAVTNNGYGG